MNYIFSIIIPHYNIPELLVRCVNSIPIRKDIQVIVVDDCSPNADKYTEQYPELSRPYLEFYSTSMGGSAGRARNVGLEHAKGKWLLFADADDLFVDNLEEILDSKIDAEEDIVFFRKRSVLSSDITKKSCRSSWADLILDEYFKTGNEIELRRGFYAPWCKLIKRTLVEDNQIRFDETRFSNDAFFSVSVGVLADKIAVEDFPIYILTEREGSLMDNFCKKPKELEERAQVCIEVQRFLKRNHYPLDLLLLADYSYKFYLSDKKNYKRFVEQVRGLDISIKMFIKELYYNYKKGINCRAFRRFWYELYVMKINSR